jgi:hypothetical protein
MFGSWHLYRASNVEIGVKCQIFVFLSFLTADDFYNLGHIQGIIVGALTQKRSFLVICTTYRSDFRDS